MNIRLRAGGRATASLGAAACTALLLAGCQGTPQLGQGGSMAQGSAGGAGAQAATRLARCPKPLGTAALVEPAGGYSSYLTSLGLSSPLPVLRLMMQQSGCFRVTDRGAALGTIQTEDSLAQTGMLRQGSTTARGNMVTAQWLVTPNVIFSNQDAGGMGALAGLGGYLGSAGAMLGTVAGNTRLQEAQTALYLTDAQSGIQEAVSEGSASVTDFGGLGGLGAFGGGVGGLAGVSGYGNTAEGKLVAAALLDAFNKLVAQVNATRPNATVPGG